MADGDNPQQVFFACPACPSGVLKAAVETVEDIIYICDGCSAS
jgi:hypothetical protein